MSLTEMGQTRIRASWGMTGEVEGEEDKKP